MNSLLERACVTISEILSEFLLYGEQLTRLSANSTAGVHYAMSIGGAEMGRIKRLRDATMTPSTEENKDLVKRHFEAINRQDWKACTDTLAEEIAVHQGGKTHHGVEWYRNHLEDFYDAIPDASININEILSEGDKVAVRITNLGTTDGEIPGIKSSGTAVEFSSHLIARVEDGVLTELWVVAEQPRPVST